MLMLLLMTMIVMTSNDMRSMKKVQLHESYSLHTYTYMTLYASISL